MIACGDDGEASGVSSPADAGVTAVEDNGSSTTSLDVSTTDTATVDVSASDAGSADVGLSLSNGPADEYAELGCLLVQGDKTSPVAGATA